MMVGRELSAVFPKVDVPSRARSVLEVERPGLPGVGRAWTSSFERPRRRDPRPGRPGRGGADGAGARPLRPDARRRGRDPARAAGPWRSTRPARAVALGIAYVPEDRRRHGVILEMSVAANTTLATLRADLAARPARLRPRARGRRRSSSDGSGSRPPSLDAPVGQPLGRQPAEGGAGALAGGRPRGAHPRRADAGRRRRGQGRDPPADGRAGRARAGDPDDLVRAARDPRHERPDRRDARRDDRRRARPGRGDPGGDPGAGARAHVRAARAGWRHDAGRYRRELSVAAAYAAAPARPGGVRAPVLPGRAAPRVRRSATPRCWWRRWG